MNRKNNSYLYLISKGGRKSMKRITSLLLVMVMLFSVSAVMPELAHAAEQAEALTVGQTTMLSGNFFCELWGNNTADIDVRSLLHDYPLVSQTQMGEYEINHTVVSQVSKEEEENGDITYRITLKRGLKFSDGSPIGAKDYLFTFLLLSSPQVRSITGLTPPYAHIAGFQEYNDGTAKMLSGLRLVNDRVFTLKVKSEYLPYFYELTYINADPYPISVILPGAEVADDGEGAYISGEMTEEILKGTLLDSETGYISHPSVSSGPYRLLSYDAEEHVAELEINPHYKGNYEGQQPSIPRLRFKNVLNQEIHEQLASGEVDVVNKVSDGEVIDKALTLQEGGELGVTSYARSGAAYLAIAGERSITSSLNVRQALASCIDYDVLPEEFLKGHGERVYGYYGLGQWMPKAVKKDMNRLTQYKLDIGGANNLLIFDGWIFNKDGGYFRRGDEGLRYRRTADGSLEPLSLRMAVTPQNKAAELLFNMLRENTKELGVEIVAEEMPFDKALRQYYGLEERSFDLFFMGTNFGYFFNPGNIYRMNDGARGIHNSSGIQDKRLAELAAAVTRVPEGDVNEFYKAWLAFQVYWTEILPMIPLYSNTYYDLYTPDLMNYHPEDYLTCSTALLYANLER